MYFCTIFEALATQYYLFFAGGGRKIRIPIRFFYFSFFETISYFLGTGTYGTGEKRRKPMQLSSLTYLLEDSEVIDDLKIINKNKAFSVRKLGF